MAYHPIEQWNLISSAITIDSRKNILHPGMCVGLSGCMEWAPSVFSTEIAANALSSTRCHYSLWHVTTVRWKVASFTSFRCNRVLLTSYPTSGSVTRIVLSFNWGKTESEFIELSTENDANKHYSTYCLYCLKHVTPQQKKKKKKKKRIKGRILVILIVRWLYRERFSPDTKSFLITIVHKRFQFQPVMQESWHFSSYTSHICIELSWAALLYAQRASVFSNESLIIARCHCLPQHVTAREVGHVSTPLLPPSLLSLSLSLLTGGACLCSLRHVVVFVVVVVVVVRRWPGSVVGCLCDTGSDDNDDDSVRCLLLYIYSNRLLFLRYS